MLGVVLAVPAAAVGQALVPVAVDQDGVSQRGGRPFASADGRFVMFGTGAPLVPGDTNETGDIYVRDLIAGTTTRASVGTQGQQVTNKGEGTHGWAISADGRFVLFTTGNELTPEDTSATICASNGTIRYPSVCNDLYIRDRQTGETSLVSKTNEGLSWRSHVARASMSADARFVLFTSIDDEHRPKYWQVFVRDRQLGTTTFVNLPNIGPSQGTLTSSEAAMISGDGRSIIYQYELQGPTAPGLCGYSACSYIAVLDRDTGIAQVIDVPRPAGLKHSLAFVDISADGRVVLIRREVYIPPTPTPSYDLLYIDRQESRIVPLRCDIGYCSSPRLSGDGRAVAYLDRLAGLEDQSAPSAVKLYDDASRQTMTLLAIPQLGPYVRVSEVNISSDRSRLFFPWSNSQGSGSGLYALTVDDDGDGMPGGWETTYGLQPGDASDAGADADGDGRTNLQEYRNGTHPRGTVARYLAEGASNSVFSSRIALFNPGDSVANLVVRFLGPNGPVVPTRQVPLAARERTTIEAASLMLDALGDFSTVVESDRMVVVERTMDVRGVGHGAHTETSIVQPSTTWFFAEGATGGPFSLFYLLQNPSDDEANVTISYLLPAPQAPVTRTYTVGARARRTIFVDQEDPLLEAADVSARITSDRPIVAERSLYLASLGQPLGAVAGGAGVTAPATRWFLAEGATGSFFDLYVLVANPEPADAAITLTYLLPDGTSFTKTTSVAARSRLTIAVDGEDARLSDTAVSIVVESTNGVPIVVERTMWWPQGAWHEAHLSLGATATAKRWALAEGEVGGSRNTDTYILLANPSDAEVQVSIGVYYEGQANADRTTARILPPRSRTNFPVRLLMPDNWNGTTVRFGALIETGGEPIVVERAMYWNVDGIPWAAGTASLGAPIP